MLYFVFRQLLGWSRFSISETTDDEASNKNDKGDNNETESNDFNQVFMSCNPTLTWISFASRGRSGGIRFFSGFKLTLVKAI
jgi:hypothetical protein